MTDRRTVSIVLPDGYATAEEFAKDCGFELAQSHRRTASALLTATAEGESTSDISAKIDAFAAVADKIADERNALLAALEPITAFIGGMTFHPEADDTKATALVEIAQAAISKAKEGGRERARSSAFKAKGGGK